MIASRILLFSTGALVLGTGCVASWELKLPERGNCVERPFFYDGDEDGWGAESAEFPMQMLCIGDETSGYTARNDRDCDDGDPGVTGRVGAVCPCELTTDDPANYATCADGMSVGGAEYVGWVGADSEFIAVLGVSETVTAEMAETICEMGWGYDAGDGLPGAWLATFDAGEVAEAESALTDAGITEFAGFVGLEPNGSGGWAWTDDATTPVSDIDKCNPSSNSIAAEPTRLALVLSEQTSVAGICLGTPADAGYAHETVPEGSAEFYYSSLFGHFICERPIPDPADYWMPIPDSAG